MVYSVEIFLQHSERESFWDRGQVGVNNNTCGIFSQCTSNWVMSDLNVCSATALFV